MATNRAEYSRAYYAENKASILATNRKYRAKDTEGWNARAREYHHANRDEINRKRREKRKANPEHYRALRHTRIYGLLPAEIELMTAEQGGRCAVCCEETDLVVDHCHDSGQVRALLCSNCNTAIGLLQDDPQRARLAARYLDKHAMMKAKAVAGQNGAPQGG